MCLPCKEVEDQQMGIVAAQLYARTIADMTSVPSIDKSAPLFYSESLAAQREVAKYLIFNKKLTNEQIDRLIAQTQESCYRAEKLVEWSRMKESEIQGKTGGWTDKLFEWQKNDQEFFTELLNEVGDWYEFAKGGA